MTPAAEKDIRSALRQLRGCRGRLAMARTGRLSSAEDRKVALAQIDTSRALAVLLALLGAERPVPRRKVRLKYPNGDAKGVF